MLSNSKRWEHKTYLGGDKLGRHLRPETRRRTQWLHWSVQASRLCCAVSKQTVTAALQREQYQSGCFYRFKKTVKQQFYF